MPEDYQDPFAISRQERLKKLYQNEPKGLPNVDQFKRKQVLEQEYAREHPDEPIREQPDSPVR